MSEMMCWNCNKGMTRKEWVSHACVKPKEPAQSLPPEPGKLEEEAEAENKAAAYERNLSDRYLEETPPATIVRRAYAGGFRDGARSRDARIKELEKESWALAYSRDHHENEGKRLSALLASQGERIKELEAERERAVECVNQVQNRLGSFTVNSGDFCAPLREAFNINARYLQGKQSDYLSLRAALEQVKAERDELKVAETRAYLKGRNEAFTEALKAISEVQAGNRFPIVQISTMQATQWLKNRGASALLAAGEKAGGENV